MKNKRKDEFESMSELIKKVPKEQYRIVCCDRNSSALIIAPHGGGIEPFTSRIAQRIAGSDLNFFAFEGRIKNARGRLAGNLRLHVTSTHYDLPEAIERAKRSSVTVAIHGAKGTRIQIGGLDAELGKTIAGGLRSAGYPLTSKPRPNLAGASPDNICNRNFRSMGVQVELPKSLRAGATDEWKKIAGIIRRAILKHLLDIVPKPSKAK